jgi:alpha-beta hydrolase superfamily lysophospholipase
MTTALDLNLDVTEAAGLGEPAHIALTVTLPDPVNLLEEPVVCFGKPGGGYSKGYFTVALPGPGQGAQASWHAERGWIFVSVDHIGVGASSIHDNAMRLDYTTCAATALSAETQLLEQLAAGTLVDGFPKVENPLTLGIGQSMGGCLSITQQGRHHCYDGVGILGYSAVWTHPPAEPGQPSIGAAWLTRDTLTWDQPTLLNQAQLEQAMMQSTAQDPPPEAAPPMAWGFHYDDVDRETIDRDLVEFPTRKGNVPPWGSATLPDAVASSCLTPGIVASEAAAITSPVLVAMGERDVGADNAGEPRAYLSSNSVDLFVCPRMGHMHNFASTRELFWRRIETWAKWVSAVKSSR